MRRMSLPMDLQREDEEKGKTESILRLTLEIIYLLTGEDYRPLRKETHDNAVLNNYPSVSGGPFLISGNNKKKIMEITKKIIELLMGEVPIRCQDVTVYLSMEEWEYLEGHKDLYKDFMMEDEPDRSRKRNTPEGCPPPLDSPDSSQVHQEILQDYKDLYKDIMMEDQLPHTSPDGSRKRNPPERCPCPLDSRDSTQEHPGYQGGDLIVVKLEPGEEEPYVMGDEPDEEELSLEISTDGYQNWNNMEKQPVVSPGGKSEDDKDNTTDSLQECSNIPDDHPILQSTDSPHEPSGNSKCFPEHSETITPAADRDLQCSECGQYFSLPEDLLCHQSSCACSERFESKSGLTGHQKAFGRWKLYSCSQCGKTFSYKHNLVSHQSIHRGDKPYSCSACGRRFLKKSNLDAHQRTHSGEKPFTCSQCGKSFAQKSTLVRHKRTHTGFHPYSCSECGKTFAQKSGLVRHQATHTGAYPYTCSECGKGFTAKSVLLTHQRVHTGEKPFLCSRCGKCFGYKESADRHRLLRCEVDQPSDR